MKVYLLKHMSILSLINAVTKLSAAIFCRCYVYRDWLRGEEMNQDPELNMKTSSKMKYRFSMPHIYVIFLFLMIIATICTYFIPTGVYDRVPGPDGGKMIDTTTYHRIEQNPVSILKLFVAIPQGFVEAGWVIALTFCVGGAFAIVKETGIIQIGVDRLARRLAKRGIIVIPILMILFSTIDAFIGMPELTMVYVPIILPLALALGFDSITATAIALCGSTAGFTAALTNPFTTATGQKISGLPLYSGIEYRIICWLVFLSIAVIFVMRYAKKIKNNPQLSLMYIEDNIKRQSLNTHEEDTSKINKRQIITGLVAMVLFLFLIYGVIRYKWDMPEIGGIFIVIGITSGLIAGLSAKQIGDSFNNGCRDVLPGALIIGFARGIAVIMNEGQILDTIVHAISIVLQTLPGSISVIGMLIFQSIFSFLVSSGSGQALITMPIMAPLADILGITRQTSILAFQFGDGFTNIFYPTSGYFMAVLAISGISWDKWARFAFPLIVLWLASAAVLLVIAHAIRLGPF